jgi:hypothetical protein
VGETISRREGTRKGWLEKPKYFRQYSQEVVKWVKRRVKDLGREKGGNTMENKWSWGKRVLGRGGFLPTRVV